MNFFDDKYRKREKTHRRSYSIDSSLLTQLESLSEIYCARVSAFINDSIEELIKSEDIKIYERDESELSIKYTVLVRESNLQGLNELCRKYGISVSKLVNIAIRNALNN